AQHLVVLGAAVVVRENAIRLGQRSGAFGRHRLEFPAEMLNLVGMIERDLLAERALDLVSRGRRRNVEQRVIVLDRHLWLLELGDVGCGELAAAVDCLAIAKSFGNLLRFGAAGAVRAEIPSGLQRATAVRTAAADALAALP